MGGGLAGIAASSRLAEGGLDVTLLEARRTLGGRVFSYTDNDSAHEVDNGQHVIVGACRNLITFLKRIGAWQDWYLQRSLDVAVYDHNGKEGRLYGVNLPAPAHLLPSFVTYPHLGKIEKLQAVRGLLSAMTARRDDQRMEAITFYDWLRARGQSEGTISHLWNVLIEGTLNDNVRDVSAAMGLMIVQDGLLKGRHTADLGYPTVALGSAIGEPAKRHLESLGVRVVPGCVVQRVNCSDDGAVTGVSVVGGNVLSADAYVSALPFWVLPSLLPESLAARDPFARLAGLQTSPIVNVHLTYDRPVMCRQFCYFVDSPLQWVFNGSGIRGQNPGDHQQSITVSISAAWEFIDWERGALASKIVAEMQRAFPRTANADLVNVTVVKQRNATFRCVPGAGALRPGPITPSPNLFLAGEWTDTGWPSTMESAIISGYNAAAAVMLPQRTIANLRERVP